MSFIYLVGALPVLTYALLFMGGCMFALGQYGRMNPKACQPEGGADWQSFVNVGLLFLAMAVAIPSPSYMTARAAKIALEESRVARIAESGCRIGTGAEMADCLVDKARRELQGK